jgi:propanol-preferring alcohol dehydrogenase
MRAMVLTRPGEPLSMRDLPDPNPGADEIRIRVAACGVCRTDLHVVDGELPNVKFPIIPGHEIVGYVEALGTNASTFHLGERVGIPWLGHTCGMCPYCVGGRENLCDRPLFTGYTRDGGYATHAVAEARYVFRLGETATTPRPLPCSAPDSSAGGPWSSPGKASGSGFMDLGPPRTS